MQIFRGPATGEDVLVEATFFNPYSAVSKYWEHGFLLKDGRWNSQYWVSIDSNGDWLYFHRLGSSEAIGRVSQQSSHINWKPGGKNLLQIAMIDDVGYVYINGVLQGRMELDADTGGNGITIFVDDEHAGETRFEDFTVWKWDSALVGHFPDTDPGFMPTPTPMLGQVHDPAVSFRELRGERELRREMPERWQLIWELPWISDGLVFSEEAAAQGLIYLTLEGGDYFPKFMELPWVIEGRNKPAMEALGGLAGYYPEEFKKVIKHPTIRDGITDEGAKIVATLNDAAAYNPDLVETLLDPEKVTSEERAIDLPLAGQVLLTIIRTRPGAAATMDLLETAVRTVEGYMSLPLLRQQAIYFFGDAVLPTYDGHNSWSIIVSLPGLDRDNYDPESALNHFAHELAHYYWRASEAWISEGGAMFIEAIQNNASTGWPLHPQNGPCPYVDSIAELERLDPEQRADSAYSCNYSLGERLFHDLYRVLGDTAFQSGFSRLYLLRLADDPDDDCEGIYLGICHVAAAFKADASEEAAAKVDQVIACWYEGDKTACPDTGPADPLTPVLGPMSGAIPHQPDDGYLELSDSFNNSGDVMIEVTFENPYGPRESHWVYGIIFRSSIDGSSHRVFVNSWKAWRHGYYSAEKDQHGRGRADDAPGIDVSEGGENRLRLIVIEDTGWLYVNDRFIANINFTLGNLPAPDQISLVIVDSGRGLNYKQGDLTRYRDFTIWKWHPDLFELPKDD